MYVLIIIIIIIRCKSYKICEKKEKNEIIF